MSANQPIYIHLLLTAVIAAVLPIVLPSYVLATEILIFAMAAIGCNLLLGYTGLLSFGQALFFGAGAYAAGLLSIHYNLGLVPTILASILTGAVLAVIVGFFAIRRKGIYFVMLTLAFAQLGYYVAFLAEPITGGEDGLLDVVRPTFTIPFVTEFKFATDTSFYILTSIVFVLIFVAMQRLVDSPLGSVLKAIKQNEARAEAIGYQVKLYKIAVFAFSGAVTAVAGTFYATMLRFAPLSNIDIETSEVILFMCVLGGLGSLYGSVFGAIIFLVATDILADLWPRWMLLLGLLLIIVMLYLPGGLSEATQKAISKLRGSDIKKEGSHA
ncbi:MAG TPA: branched-chain amino acid ABC transporter permease [Rhizobiales bacterium]|nr:branched-chain amino acid ABC transporter permease [Hyphomicrobiales bacterium]